jgi:hypothetical protein
MYMLTIYECHIGLKGSMALPIQQLNEMTTDDSSVSKLLGTTGQAFLICT